MKKFLSLLLLLLLLPSCGAPAPEAPAEPPPPAEDLTLTDDLGRTITLPEPPARVAALTGSFAEIWCLAGGKPSLCAAAGDTWTLFDLDLPPDTVDLGGVKAINTEALLAAEPDLVLLSATTSANAGLLPFLEEAGIPAACFSVSTFPDYLRMLEACTRLTGSPENYDLYGASVQAQVDAARARVDGSAPTVVYIRATGSGCKVKDSHDSVLGEMLADLGCVNLADSGLELSLEAIAAGDPEFIFAVVQGSDPTQAQALLDSTLLSHPLWASLTAVREGRFHILDQRLYNLKPNAKWGTAYEKLAKILYPDPPAEAP